MTEPKQYAYRDIIALDKKGGHYCRHVMALTAEGLHAKSDIAAELAWRDAEIERLRSRGEDWYAIALNAKTWMENMQEFPDTNLEEALSNTRECIINSLENAVQHGDLSADDLADFKKRNPISWARG